MQHEKSCGALVFRKNPINGKEYVLMVRNRHGRFYSFPKGHMEKGETEIMTAEREVREETSVSIQIQSDFRQTVSYSPMAGVEKEVVYFLAKTRQTSIRPREGEIEEVRWIPLEKALSVLTHENDKKVLLSALEARKRENSETV